MPLKGSVKMTLFAVICLHFLKFKLHSYILFAISIQIESKIQNLFLKIGNTINSIAGPQRVDTFLWLHDVNHLKLKLSEEKKN